MRTLETRDFRNLARIELALPAEGIAIVGDNGHGKTNLLEAMAYLHLLRSVRGARDVDAVHFGSSGFHVRGEASSAAPTAGISASNGPPTGASASMVRTVRLGFERATRRKRVVVDGIAPARLSDALGAIPSVTFAPADVELVRGGPVGRRRYLDVTLATTSRPYLAALQSYRSALLQRNTALRELARRGPDAGPAAVAAVGAWEPLLAESGAVLWAERIAWAVQRTPSLARLCAETGEQGVIHMRHIARLPGVDAIEEHNVAALKQALATALEAGRGGDLRHGATRTGPHRDDLVLTLAGRELRVFGSAGQQRTVAIALRVLEADTLRDHTGAGPVMLFDDPFAELDARRGRAILEILGGASLGQVVLAVPRAADIPAAFTRLARHTIVGGVVKLGEEAA